MENSQKKGVSQNRNSGVGGLGGSRRTIIFISKLKTPIYLKINSELHHIPKFR